MIMVRSTIYVKVRITTSLQFTLYHGQLTVVALNTFA
jgi:hypothetical protein